MIKNTVSIAVLVLALCTSISAHASCTWSFNWYCSACAKIGGRTTGSQGGYASPEQCESARRSVAREVTTGSCSSSGMCSAPASGGGRPAGVGRIPQGSGGYAQPEFDAEAALRRAEEERMRREAEEAERRAKEKTEDERRQRQFVADKLDALSSMKGADFDGAGGDLKPKGADEPVPPAAPTAAFGIRSNPAREPSAPAAGAESDQESRFSKGSRFSAPVDLATKDLAGPLTLESADARAILPDGRLGQFLADRDWPAYLKGQTALALLDLDRGRPERAAEMLAAAAKARPQDGFLKQAAARSTESAKGAPIRFDPESLSKALSKEAYAAYVVGWEYLQQGDMNGAARMFGRARDASPNNSVLQQLVAETEKRRRILAPDEQRAEDERRQRAREYAQGNAALRLGLNAAGWNNVLAINYLDEAARRFPGIEWHFVEQTRRQIAARNFLEPGSYWKYHYKNRGEAMLDALEYGNGDHAAALRYLRHAGQIQQKNPVVEAAYRELERLGSNPGKP